MKLVLPVFDLLELDHLKCDKSIYGTVKHAFRVRHCVNLHNTDMQWLIIHVQVLPDSNRPLGGVSSTLSVTCLVHPICEFDV